MSIKQEPSGAPANDTPVAGTFDNGTNFDFSNNGTDTGDVTSDGGAPGPVPDVPDVGTDGGDGTGGTDSEGWPTPPASDIPSVPDIDGTGVPSTDGGDTDFGPAHDDGSTGGDGTGNGSGEPSGEDVLNVLNFLTTKVHEKISTGWNNDEGPAEEKARL